MTFKRLQTKLTVLYMGLFGVALLVVAIAVVTAISSSARGVVRDELAASGEVYEQIWDARSDQLRQGAAVLAQDYGFREALATGDEATVRSALDNLRKRQGVDGAMILATDGYLTSTGVSPVDAEIDVLWNGLDQVGVEAGILTLEGQAYQAVAAPIMAPVLIGWVVFVERLDDAQMRNLESLSAIPLSASVMSRSPSGWGNGSGPQPMLGTAIESGLASANAVPVTTRTEAGPAMALAKALPSFDDNQPSVLVLTYPIAAAMKPYQPLFIALGAIALIGAAILAAGTFFLTRDITRPISVLDKAVQKLQQGDHVEVVITSQDEIGRLAESFNGMAGDIRDREARLTHMALHDQESGLPNRLWLEREAAIDAGRWVVLLGVDRFEVVRNAIGYDSMAQMMSALGARLVGLAEGVVIARIGAGALGLVVEAGDEAEARIVAERLCAKAEAPIKLSGTTVDVSLTAGVSTCGHQTGGVNSPIDRAAIALDQARAGKTRATLFDSVAYGDPGGNLSLISDLMAGLKTRDVWVAYQPKYDLRTGVINGAEALMRWRDPKRGFVSPDLFIGMAEETGQIRPLTEWVMRQAIKDQRALAKAGHDVVLSVNVSGRLLSDENFAEFALNKVAAANAKLCFEVTETAVIDNPEVALAIIDRFAAAGIGVSIDDYGSGLSSLTYLKQIRADELKIDKSFIMPLETSSRDALLVKSTIDLAHSLGLKVTAEGVETATALALLQGMGCDIAQGYFIARPMPIADLIVRLGEPAMPGVVSISSPGPETPTPGWLALSGTLSG